LWNAGKWEEQRSFSPLAKAVLDEGLRLHALTDGWMDPSVGKYTEAWGFTGKSAILGLGNAKSDTLAMARLQQSRRVVYDVNAFAQGHSVDGVAQLLSQMGVKHALVELGGELFALGGKPDGLPFQVAVDAPQEERSTTPATQVPLESQGMATSGNYRKYRTDPTTGRKYGHTLNPFTGWTAQTDVLSATVLAPSASEADGVATALVAMGQSAAKKWAIKHPEVQVFLIYSDKKGNVQTFQTIP
jgi:thiamine biosynthesis lipoprotein